jgi:F-type H+-transporting ATPase subunit epsilon
VTLRVSLVVPDRELWSGEARTVIAKTTEGDIGVLTGHSPVFGILAEGSLVEILPLEGSDAPAIRAAVSGGFLSVANDQVSVLAAQALLDDEVDVSVVRQELDVAVGDQQHGDDESSEVKYARARLRLAGEQA